MSRSASPSADFLPFAKLTQKSIPPRVRSLLEGLYQTAWPPLESGLGRALDELDRDLFVQAEKVMNSNEQQRFLEGAREFRKQRGAFITAFRDALQRSIVCLLDTEIQAPTLKSRRRGTSEDQLSLVEPAELEQQLAMSEIAARAEIRAGNALQALSYRIAVIVGRAPIDVDSLAFGPHKICAAIAEGARKFDVPTLHRIALFRRIDKAIFKDPVAIYDSLNGFLIAHRVFAHLHLGKRKVSAPRAVEEHAQPGSGASRERVGQKTQDSAESSAPEQMQAPLSAVDHAPELSPEQVAAGEPSGAGHETSGLAPPPTSDQPVAYDSPSADAFQRIVDADATDQQLPPARPAAPPSAPVADTEFFQTLRELLSGRRGPVATAEASALEARPLAEVEDVQSVLSLLQSQPSAPVMVDGRWVARTTGHIKKDLMSQLRALHGGSSPKLREEDSDTIDLVGMLFDHLLAEHRPNSASHGLLSRLQVPLMKVALSDKKFFTRRDHSARQLLNSIAETSSFWSDDDEADQPIIEKMQVVVDRVVKEYDDDIEVFSRLFDDLSRHLGGVKKKAEVAERRHVEAAKGKEKLELARAAAQEAVQQRLFDANPPEAVKELLEKAWADAIALSLLRLGIDNPKSRERLALVDQLLGVFVEGASHEARQAGLEALQPCLEEGLAAVGFHGEAIAKVWSDISALIDSSDEGDHAAASDAITNLIGLRPRLGGDAGPSTVKTEDGSSGSSILQNLRKTERMPVGPQEQAMIDRIRHLPFGTWFEFTVNQQGDKVRRKLCWFSPVTGRCLFLNSRGVSAEEKHVDALARDVLRGNVRVIDESHDSFIDRAWKGIMSVLKGVGLGGVAPSKDAAGG